MNWSNKTFGFGLCGICLATTALGDVNPPSDNAYRVVVERNAFGLSPPKVIALPTNAPPAKKSEVKFTGITIGKDGKKAWLVLPPPANNRTQNPQYLSMRENETQGDIQVLKIDDKENTVEIVNAGVSEVLNFKDNGYTTPTMAAMPGNPMLQHGLPGVSQPPGGLPGVLPPPGIVPAPTTPVPGGRTAGVTPTGLPANEALAARYGVQTTAGGSPNIAPVRTIPTRPLRTPVVEPQATADPVVQHIIREANQFQMEQQQGIKYPPLPPPPGK